MKRIFRMLTSLIGLFFMLNVHASNQVTVQIKFQQAKNIYNMMTGKTIKNEGAAGHLYRTGKSIVCQYTDVDMSDSRRHPISAQDPMRYSCFITFNRDGFATPAA